MAKNRTHAIIYLTLLVWIGFLTIVGAAYLVTHKKPAPAIATKQSSFPITSPIDMQKYRVADELLR